jgi:hypothetical protein
MIHIGRHNVGRIAERIVSNELEAHGFRVSDLNSDGTAANADLLAIAGDKNYQVQVKGAANKPTERWWVGYGYCTTEIIASPGEPVFNRRKSFYTADVVVLVAIKAPMNYSCVVLPIDKAKEAVQLNLEYAYRTPTRTGEQKKPHLIWTYLEPSARERRIEDRLVQERNILSAHRDEPGWLRLLQSN